MEGRQANIFYDDGERVSCKSGQLLQQDPTLITIKTADGREITIPVARIIRVEVFGGK